MKILWSSTAVFGLVLSIIEGAPMATYGFLATFVIFFGVWLFYRIRI